MKCRDPKLCYTNSKGMRQLRHFSLASDFFIHLHQQVFDCGTCIFCRKKKSYELASRCVLHASLYRQNCFLTLTYDEKKTSYHNKLEYSDIQKFKKRLRQHCQRDYGKKIEIFNVHEYGKNGKKHWHLVVFNHDFTDKEKFGSKNNIPYYTSKKLQKLWKHGFVSLGDVSEASAMYQAQYMEKDIKNGNLLTAKKSKSNHSGIGKNYFLKHYKQILELGYVPIGGKKLPIPRYFQKIAHKHWSHFYEKSNFFDTPERKKLYTPFKTGLENKEIADLFIQYKNNKQEFIQELEKNWNEVINIYLQTGDDPDFVKSANNFLYDMRNKLTDERF